MLAINLPNTTGFLQVFSSIHAGLFEKMALAGAVWKIFEQRIELSKTSKIKISLLENSYRLFFTLSISYHIAFSFVSKSSFPR